MKWAIAGLACLGIVAAACAALLVSALRSGAMRPGHGGLADAEVHVLVAAHPLHEMTVVDSESVILTSMPRSQAPLGFLTDPVQVVGRILLVPMGNEQSFTTACFANDDKTAHLAALLPRGKRAVGITVSDYAGLEGVLYPGCAVDIMVTTKLDGDGRTRPSSRMLLENIPVWGIERQTIVSSADKIGADTDSPKSGSHRRITVLVDTKQAKQLEKGMEEGTLSLALRGPLDNTMEVPDAIVVSPAAPIDEIHAAPVTHPAAAWDVVITRGEQSQTQSFSVTEGERSHGHIAAGVQPVERTPLSADAAIHADRSALPGREIP